MNEFKVKIEKMAGNVSVVSGKYDFAFFIILRNMGKKCILEWCMSMGLITDKYECANCKKPMKLMQRSDGTDGYVWICRTRRENKHEVTRSARHGSFFQASKTSIINIIMMAYFWVKNVQITFVADELDIGRNTIIEWYDYFREFCIDMCANRSTVIGGSEVVVELVESKFGKKKYFGGSRVSGKWMYGATEVNTGKCFLQVVESRNKDSLLNLLDKYVLPGTVIVSDCWKEYRCAKDSRFVRMAADRGLVFKDLCPTSVTSPIFELRSKIKTLPYGHRRSLEQYDSHLAEFMWKRLNSGNPQSMFQAFLKEIVKVFPPQIRD